MSTDHKRKCWIGFDLGGTKMLCQAFDSEFSCLSRNRNRTRGYEGSKSGVERIIKLIAETLEAINLPTAALLGAVSRQLQDHQIVFTPQGYFQLMVLP